MNRLKVKILAGLLGVLMASTAFAGHGAYTDYARVVSAQPVYERVARSVPQRECRIENVRYEYPLHHRPSATGTLVGTMLGAAVGHQIGRDREAKKIGRVAGALLGASIGSDASRRSAGPNRVEYRDEEYCEVRYSNEYGHEIVGYDVTYLYDGKMYNTRMDHNPGSEIKVAVDVRPAY